MIIKINLLFILLFALLIPVKAQDSVLINTRDSVVIIKEKPSIYLSLVENVGNSDDKKQDFLLRLTNNTRWAIRVPTGNSYFAKSKIITLFDGRSVFALTDNFQAEVNYQIEKKTPNDVNKISKNNNVSNSEITTSIVIPRPSLFYYSWIPSGTSIIFRVSLEYASKEFSIYVPCNFEWQTNKNNTEPNEPDMRIYLRIADLEGLVRIDRRMP